MTMMLLNFTNELCNLVRNFEALHDLQPHVPQRESPHPIKVSMEIMFKDENMKAETIDILADLTLRARGRARALFNHATSADTDS